MRIFKKRETEPTYGHPLPPVKTLLNKLNKAPLGYFWEVSVGTDEKDDTPQLCLRLMSAITGQQEGSSWLVNLVHSKGDISWQTIYNDCLFDDWKKRRFFESIIDPLVNKSNDIIARYEPREAYGLKV